LTIPTAETFETAGAMGTVFVVVIFFSMRLQHKGFEAEIASAQLEVEQPLRLPKFFLCRLAIELGFPISPPLLRSFGVGLYETRALAVSLPAAVTRIFLGT
jgi:hypothetical protein